ncbi:MAG: right-handed parallel beta-helix repeat-containing protein, partial [Candidatus Thorarchaeota archaeon]
MLSIWVPVVNPTTSNTQVVEQSQQTTLSYESHSNIYIQNHSEFARIAGVEGWDGDGSSETPFIIEGYEIEASEVLIEIHDSRYYFEIRDCNLTDAMGVIYLENVTNGHIENCIINEGFYDGIYMENVNDTDVVNCQISMSVAQSQQKIGINMDNCFDCDVNDTTIEGVTDSSAGINCYFCEDITLFNNTVFNFDNHGIHFDECEEMSILNNTVYWNEGGLSGPQCGIDIEDSEIIDIIGNNLTENEDNGITITATPNVTVIDNYITSSKDSGIEISSSDDCYIEGNEFVDNGWESSAGPSASAVLAIFSDHCEIIDNDFHGNLFNSITVAYSEYCKVTDNFINVTYTHGLELYMSHNTTVERNEIHNSYGMLAGGPRCGIYVDWTN